MIGFWLVVVRLTVWLAAVWPEKALNVRLGGFAMIVPLPPPVLGVNDTDIDCAAPPFVGVRVTTALHPPARKVQLVFAS